MIVIWETKCDIIFIYIKLNEIVFNKLISTQCHNIFRNIKVIHKTIYMYMLSLTLFDMGLRGGGMMVPMFLSTVQKHFGAGS